MVQSINQKDEKYKNKRILPHIQVPWYHGSAAMLGFHFGSRPNKDSHDESTHDQDFQALTINGLFSKLWIIDIFNEHNML